MTKTCKVCSFPACKKQSADFRSIKQVTTARLGLISSSEIYQLGKTKNKASKELLDQASVYECVWAHTPYITQTTYTNVTHAHEICGNVTEREKERVSVFMLI